MHAELLPPATSLPSVDFAVLEGAIAQAAGSPRDLLNLREQAEVLRRLAKRHEAADIQFTATAAKLKCERALGEAIRSLIRTYRSSGRPRIGGRLKGSAKILPDGISDDQSSTWQKLAALPEVEFEKWLHEHRDAGTELTQKSLLDRANLWIQKQQNDLTGKGCGNGEDDLDDEDADEDDEPNDGYIARTILSTTVADRQELLADLSEFQRFFDTDNLTDTVMAMWRQMRAAIKERE